MDQATLLATIDPDWAYKAQIGSPGVTAPSGVFYGYAPGAGYCPTVTYSRKTFYDGDIQIGLLREATALEIPATLTVNGTGSCILTNTGKQSLQVGQKFTVEYPTAADKQATAEAAKMNLARLSHVAISEQLWSNGFLATVPYVTSKDRLLNHLEQDVATYSDYSFCYSLGKLQALCRGHIPGNQTWPMLYYNAVGRQQVIDRDTAAASIQAGLPHYIEVMFTAQELLSSFKPRVYGIVQQAAVGGQGPIIQTGCQFHAHITFNC
nr:tri2 [Herpesvirus DDDp]